jgi:hypothetical protein
MHQPALSSVIHIFIQEPTKKQLQTRCITKTNAAQLKSKTLHTINLQTNKTHPKHKKKTQDIKFPASSILDDE